MKVLDKLKKENRLIDEHSVEKEVENERRRTTCHTAGQGSMVALDILVRVPVAAGETVVVAGPNLHETHTALEQSAGYNALA